MKCLTLTPWLTVVLPTLRRPEFLALSLESLQNIRKPFDGIIDVRIFVDTTTDERLSEVEYVRDTYYPEASIFHARPHIAASSGTWNILNSLLAGYKTGAEFVALLEEDVIVFPDWLEWSLKAHKDHDYFATCGRLRKEHSSAYYTNPGAVLSKAGLHQLVPHINDSFFLDWRGYLTRFFNSMDDASTLDDGLIRRVILASHGVVKYPDTPKCAHQGFHYYNRLDPYLNPPGPIQDRIARLREILSRVNSNDRYSHDFEQM